MNKYINKKKLRYCYSRNIRKKGQLLEEEIKQSDEAVKGQRKRKGIEGNAEVNEDEELVKKEADVEPVEVEEVDAEGKAMKGKGKGRSRRREVLIKEEC